MPLSDPKVALEFFGIDPDAYKDDEEFKEKTAREWTKVSEAAKPGSAVEKAIYGRFNGVARTKAKNLFKELELPTDGIDFDGTDALDLFEPIGKTAKASLSERIKKAEEGVKGKGVEELKTEYERRLAEQAKKVQDFETLAGSLKGELEKRDKAEKEREFTGKINGEWDQAEQATFAGIKFKNDLEKKGFQTAARERYQVKFDEQGSPYWAGKDGNRIQDGTRHQAFKDGTQLLKELAAELKVGETNPRGGAPVGRATSPAQPKNDEPRQIRQTIVRKPGRVLSDASAR